MPRLGFTTVGTNDIDRAFEFYDRVFATISVYPCYTIGKLRYYGMAWENGGPIFGVTKPINREMATVGNGNMTAFIVETDELVDHMYAAAINYGGHCAGAPAVLNQDDSQRVYGAYFRDIDGNKFLVLNETYLPTDMWL
jgi:catechol 2,3-dioxygenase-like lactoylglutathione lyase family enzyme